MSSPQWRERRHHRRFAAVGHVTGYLGEVSVRVRDISLGGFAVESSARFEAGAEHRVRFITPDNWTTHLSAQVANVREGQRADGAASFICGFSFSGADAPPRPTTSYKVRKFLLTVRYMPRLFHKPWHAPLIERIIDEKLAGSSLSPVRTLIDKATV